MRELIATLLHLPLIIFHGLVRCLTISTHAHSFVTPIAKTRCQGFRIMNGDNVSETKSNDRHIDNEFFFFRHFIALLARTKKNDDADELSWFLSPHTNSTRSIRLSWINVELFGWTFFSHSLETRAHFFVLQFFRSIQLKFNASASPVGVRRVFSRFSRICFQLSFNGFRSARFGRFYVLQRIYCTIKMWILSEAGGFEGLLAESQSAVTCDVGRNSRN